MAQHQRYNHERTYVVLLWEPTIHLGILQVGFLPIERFAHGAASFNDLTHLELTGMGQKSKLHTVRGPLVR